VIGVTEKCHYQALPNTVQTNVKQLARTLSEDALTPQLLGVRLADTMALGEKIQEKQIKA
jgi:hypothetical protein